MREIRPSGLMRGEAAALLPPLLLDCLRGALRFFPFRDSGLRIHQSGAGEEGPKTRVAAKTVQTWIDRNGGPGR